MPARICSFLCSTPENFAASYFEPINLQVVTDLDFNFTARLESMGICVLLHSDFADVYPQGTIKCPLLQHDVFHIRSLLFAYNNLDVFFRQSTCAKPVNKCVGCSLISPNAFVLGYCDVYSLDYLLRDVSTKRSTSVLRDHRYKSAKDEVSTDMDYFDRKCSLLNGWVFRVRYLGQLFWYLWASLSTEYLDGTLRLNLDSNRIASHLCSLYPCKSSLCVAL